MPQLIGTGPATTITQNVSYALPARVHFIMTSAAVETSLDNTTWTALTGANTTGVTCSAAFVRCTTGNAVVICKK